MKQCKLIFKICVLLSFIFLNTVFAQVQHVVNFSESEFKLQTITAEDGVEYIEVLSEYYTIGDSIGYPEIPFKTVHLLVPSGEDVSEIIINTSTAKEKKLAQKIFPVQEPILTSITFQKKEFVKPNKNIYEKDRSWPEEQVEFLHSDYFDGSNRIVTLAVYPYSYNPVSNELLFFESIELILETKLSSNQPTKASKRTKAHQNLYDNILERMVDNKSDISLYQVKPNIIDDNTLKKSSTTTTSGLPFYEYVIITPSAFSSAFDDFIDWKKHKGLDIGVVTTEDIYSNYTGDLISGIADDTGKVRQYLYDGWDSGITVYALLAGDYAYVPMRYGTGAGNNDVEMDEYGDAKCPADLYFADFDSDWDVDGDLFRGEPGEDAMDYAPEIYVGRLLCSSTTDISNWINKLLLYEKNPGKGNYSYLTR